MQNEIKSWWKALQPKERTGLLVLAAFMAGVVVFALGVKIGQVINIVL